MKTVTFSLLVGLLVSSTTISAQEVKRFSEFRLSAEETVAIRQKLEDFDKGRLTVDQLTDVADEEKRKIQAYFVTHTNEITVKMKLPISRLYALGGNYPVATWLAEDYVKTYKDDPRGWDVLGGTKAMLGLYGEAVEALTNAVTLGSEKNLVHLGGLAMKTDQLDLFKRFVLPRALKLKNNKQTPKSERLQISNLLVIYSFVVKREEVFVQALKDLTRADVESQTDNGLAENIRTGRSVFDSKEVAELCKKLLKDDEDSK